MKPFYKSKTVGVNFLVVASVCLLSRFVPSFNSAFCGDKDFILYVLAGINIALRSVTKEPIT